MNLIPEPRQIEFDAGMFFVGEEISVSGGIFLFEAAYLQQFMQSIYGFSVCAAEAGDAKIVFRQSEGFGKEAYRLSIASDGIKIVASHAAGAFYAVTTLIQIMHEYKQHLPLVTIEDAPLYSYRGFMLDCARYFFDKKTVKKIVDRLALHKINVLHWHLSDDQGWRVELKEFPELTEVGSVRTHTNFNHKKHEGFYSEEDIHEIVEYCHERHIRVMPEIDIPGHMRAAIAAYPALSCFERELPVATHWGVKHDILCAGKSNTYAFVHRMLDGVMRLFPDRMIHLGGDEAVKTRWKLCPHCQNKIKEQGLRDEEELQAYFIEQAAAHCIANGYRTMIWHYEQARDIQNLEIVFEYYLEGETHSNAIAEEMRRGRSIVNGASAAYYLDLPYQSVSLLDTYEYQPLPEGVETTESLQGIEASLWSEYVPDLKTAYFKMFPRLAAFAERAWAAAEKKDFAYFIKKMQVYYDYLDFLDIKPAPLSRAMPGKLRGKAEVLWFNRRVLHWEGLHNFTDNRKVEKLVRKKGTDAFKNER